MKFRLGVAVAMIAAASLFSTGAAAAVKNTLVPVSHGAHTGFGSFHPSSYAGGDDDALRRAFGRPDKVGTSRRAPGLCKMSWRGPGIHVKLAGFGTASSRPCKDGTFTEAKLTDHRWHTASGVRPGGPKRVAKRAAKRRCRKHTCGYPGYALELHHTDCGIGKVAGVIAVVPKHAKKVKALIVRWRSCE